MNRPDDDDVDISARLESLFGDEPPMESLAVDDLARGRRLSRRRRVSVVAVTAAALPTVLVGGWALSSVALGSSSGQATKLQPLDDSPTTTDDPNGVVCWSVASASPTDGSGDAGSQVVGTLPGGTAVEVPDNTDSSSDDPGSGAEGSDDGPAIELQEVPMAGCDALPGGAESCDVLSADAPTEVPGDPGEPGTVTSSEGSGEGGLSSGGIATLGKTKGKDASSDNTVTSTEAGSDDGDTLETGPGDPGGAGVIFICDNVGSVLAAHADPDGKHAGSTASGTGYSTTGDGESSESATMGWADGDREGQVSLSVQASATGDDCADPSLAAGPDVACETRTLDDGTVVQVGHGTENGAERTTVRFDWTDGHVTWATADEATDDWWRGNDGTTPLTTPPMTVDQLIDMALDKDALVG